MDDVEFDALVEACIALHREIERLDSPGVKAAYRLMLCAIGREAARRQSAADHK